MSAQHGKEKRQGVNVHPRQIGRARNDEGFMRDQQAAEQRDVARLIQAEQIRNEPAGEKQKDRGEQPDNAGNDQTAPNQPVNRL